MIKFLGAILTFTLAATAAHAQPTIKVTDLGMPTCAAITKTPSFVHNTYEGDQYDSQRLFSPWLRWSSFASKRSQFNGLIGNSQTVSSGRYDFPMTPSATVTFVVGNPSAGTLFHFWLNGNPVATIDGTAIGSSSTDYYVQLTLTGSAADAFSFEVKSQHETSLTWANFNAICPR